MALYRAHTALLPESRAEFESLAAAKRHLRKELRAAGGRNPIVHLAWDDLRVEAEYEFDAASLNEAFVRGEQIIGRVAMSVPSPLSWEGVSVSGPDL